MKILNFVTDNKFIVDKERGRKTLFFPAQK